MERVDQRRDSVHVRTVVSGSAMLVRGHPVFVTVAALGPRIPMSGRRKCGFVIHRPVSQGADHRLRRGDRDHEHHSYANNAAQQSQVHGVTGESTQQVRHRATAPPQRTRATLFRDEQTRAIHQHHPYPDSDGVQRCPQRARGVARHDAIEHTEHLQDGTRPHP